MSWIPNIFRRARLYDDLREEIRLHIEERVEQLMGEGMHREEAEREARRAFGNRTVVEERSREQWQWPTVESIGQDVRFALRQLRRSPGFTIAAVSTLALAIGANSVVFGVMNALFLRPLSVPDPQSLYTLERAGDKEQTMSYPDYLDLRNRNHSFAGLTAYTLTPVGLDTGKNASKSWGYEVTGNYFDALSVHPFLGRFFHDADEHGPNSAPYLVLSYAYWHSQFQDDRTVIGRVVHVNKHPFTILGVAPPQFNGTLLFYYPDFWAPMVQQEEIQGLRVLDARGDRDLYMVLGHLKPGVTPAQAIADLNSVGLYLEKTYPKTDASMTYTLARPSLVGDMLGPPVKKFLTGMMLLAGLILLAACANLGSLFAARTADRSREVAVRLALGATRKRILRAVFTEALLISLGGGALGLFGSVAVLRQLSNWYPIPQYPMHIRVDADATVYLAALLLALVSGFLFAAVPVRQILRTNPYEVVKAGEAGIFAGGGGRRVTLRDVLLVVQIALCAVLVTSSLVALRGLVRSMNNNFGFNPQNAVLAITSLRMSGYSDDSMPAMQRRTMEAVEKLPGVQSVGLINEIPLSGGQSTQDVFANETADLRPANAAANVFVFQISPDYFRAAETSVLAGRSFSLQDDKSSPPVAVVNAFLARKLFGSVINAVGSNFKLENGTRVLVAGVVEDGKYYQLTEDQRPAIFLPFLQSTTNQMCLVVRTQRNTQQLTGEIRSRLRELYPSLPLTMLTWVQGMNIALFPSHVATVALGVLGTMGAMLSITGIFGMAAYSVSRRLKELGIRVALGAQRKEVLQAALGRALRLLAIGSLAGLVLGFLAAKVLAFIVYQATPRDPLVLAGVILAMAFLGLVATWIPAQRALSVDPLVLLREE